MITSLLAVAAAAPANIAYQGRLLDTSGEPVNGAHTLHVAVYADGTTLDPAWGESHDLAFDSGYFHVLLGTQTPLDLGAWPSTPWVGLSLDDGMELSRQPMAAVPYAHEATAVRGGPAHVSELTVGGVLVVDDQGQLRADVPWAAVTGAPDVATAQDVSQAVSAHAADADAHHARFTAAEAAAAAPNAGNQVCPTNWIAYGDLCFLDSRRAANEGTVGDYWCRSQTGGHLCTSMEVAGIRGWRGWFGGNFWYADQDADDWMLYHNGNGTGYWYNHDGASHLGDDRAAYCCRSR